MRKIFLVIVLMIFVMGATTKVWADASMQLSPSSGSFNVNSTLSVDVIMDTGGAPTSGADFILTYPSSLLEIQSSSDVSYGGDPLFTSNTPSRDNANGKMISISTMSVATSTYIGKGTLASIKFKVKGTGTATLRFECSAGSRSDTNIWSSGSDVINCDQTSGASFTLTADTAPVATPRIGAPNPTAAATKGGLPNSGAIEVTLVFGALGILLLASGFFVPRFLRG